MDPKCKADVTIDIRNWSPEEFAPEYFDVVVACPPCTEYSQAMTRRQRKLEEADSIIKKTLEVIGYLKPRLWIMENPRNGLLPKSELVQHLPFVDCDQCQFADYGYQKPTRIWGSDHIRGIAHRRCDGRTCAALLPGQRRHRLRQGGKQGRVIRQLAYRLPPRLIEYVLGLPPIAPLDTVEPAADRTPVSVAEPKDEEWDEDLQ